MAVAQINVPTLNLGKWNQRLKSAYPYSWIVLSCWVGANIYVYKYLYIVFCRMYMFVHSMPSGENSNRQGRPSDRTSDG